MSEPSKGLAISNLQKHIRFLLNQPLEDFQIRNGVKIKDIEFDLIDISTVEAPRTIISKVILKLSE